MEREFLVTEFLDRARTYYGDEDAVVATTGERFTYDALGERTDRFAAALQARGVEKGDRVAVLDPNTHYHLEATYGALQVGAVHTPLNYRLKPAEHAYILNDAGVTAIYADHEYAPNVEPVRDEVPTEVFITDDPDAVDGDWEAVEDALAAADPDAYERPEMTEDEICTINYTSGTTGDPKGVMRSHRGETVHAYLSSHQQGIRSDDVYYWTLPMFHANGWGHLFSITGNGATHVCARGVDTSHVFDAIVAEDVSYLCAAPTVMNMLIDHFETHDPETTGDNPVRIATGGAAPPEATIRQIEEDIGWYFKHMYGLTETGPLITTSDFRRFFDQDDRSRFAVKKRQGIAMLGTEIRVVDEDGEDVPRDDETVGEIVVSGPQVMEGYWNAPEATEEAFSARAEGWFHTGDLATLNADGMLRIQDRKKDIIISGGENISSLQLEDVLFEHPAVGTVAVVPSPSEAWGETPKAYVVPANGNPDDPGVTIDDLTAFTKEHLANYKAVKRVEFVAELPTTSTGKVQKFELREAEWADEDSNVGEG